jgi:tetratricopeptide (TPR) repeat protein
MRISNINLLLAGWITVSLMAACSGVKKEKTTDIPVTTQSKEAMESFRNGLMSLDQNDNQKARTYFLKAIEQDPKLAVAYLYKSNTDLTPKEFAEDMEKAKANLEGASEWEKLYFDYSSTFLSSDWNKRLKVGQELAGKYPDAPRPQVDLGLTYLTGNETDKARACFQKAIELDPNWIGGYAAMVNAYLFFDPKDFNKAEENALKTVQLAPSSPGAQIALGDCYRAEKELEKAKTAYSKAIELDPTATDPYYKKGNANTFLGNLDEARQNFMDGGKYDQSVTGPVPFIAYTYLYAGDPKAAMKYYMEAISNLSATGNDQGRINFAKNMYLQDCASIATFYNDAPKLKELIPQIEPLSVQVGNDLGTQEAMLSQKASNLNLEALSAALDGKYEVAKSKAEEMKKTLEPLTDPAKLDGYEFVLGFTSMKEKKFSDAVAHFEKTRQTSVYNKYWLAMAYEAAGNKDKAKALYKELADYNFNGIDFALIRNEVKKKSAEL